MSSVIVPDTWKAGASGVWSLASNWSLNRAPKTSDSVEIDPASPLTVTFDVGHLALSGLTLVGATLDLEGASLSVLGAATLQNATVSGVMPLNLAGASAVSGLTLAGSVVLYNKGQATQSAGTLALTGTATVHNLAGATWTVTDASGMTQAATSGYGFCNAGTFAKTSQTGLAWIYANFYSTGTIASAVNGDIVFDGKHSYLSGTYIGAGMVDYGPDGVAYVANVNVTQACCQSNFGTVYLTGDMTMHDGSTLMNAAGAHWNFAGDVSLLLASGEAAGPDIHGLGVIAKTKGTGTSFIGIDADAEGAVAVATGTLAFEGASSAFASVIRGAGTFEIAAGAADIETGALLTVAHWTLAGGTTTLDEAVSYSGVFVGEAGATINLGSHGMTLTGPPTINSQVTLSGLDIVGSGVLTLAADAAISAATIGGTVGLVDTFVVGQTGNVTLGDATASDLASLTISSGASWDLQGSSNILLGADPASAISIASGVLNRMGAGVSTIASTVNNNCLNITEGSGYEPRGVNVEGGTLEFKGAVQGTGSDNISFSPVDNTAGTLQFDKSVSAEQTVVFFGAGATLSLTDLPDFHAAITGFDEFGSGDSILISGGYVFAGATETATSTTLSLLEISNRATQTLTLTGDYEGKTFASTTQSGVLKIF